MFPSSDCEELFNLGEQYEEGKDVEQDFVQVVFWYRLAATQGGNVEAQLYLGWCYDLGTGVEKDKVQAVHWFRLAAEQGDKYAQVIPLFIRLERKKKNSFYLY